MLIDQATIFVRSGKGGDGCMSFRREKYVPKGGPDGGDGGRGGDVILIGDDSLTTLLPLRPRPHYRATSGTQGMGKSMTGAAGDDKIVPVPLGTVVHDAETGKVEIDISEHGQRWLAARGGKGGLGNERFKSSTNQAPREWTPGEPWEERTLRLELKLMADAGLIGLPNAGKSTMLRAVSEATPKVADYPFTTLHPHLGMAALPSGGSAERRLVFADIPGLIEGASGGAGLGHDFLRHVERTGVLVHVLDVMPIDGSSPEQNYRTIRGELAGYSSELAEKPEVVVLNKIDLVPEQDRVETIDRIAAAIGLPDDRRPIVTSGATHEGVAALLEACWTLLGRRDVEGWRVRSSDGP